jgi:hypothetical protein
MIILYIYGITQTGINIFNFYILKPVKRAQQIFQHL